MDDKTSFTERTLKKIRSGDRSSETKKKRKLSRIVLIIDAIFVLLIVFYFTSKNESKKLYYSSKFNYNDIQMRFSIGSDTENRNYLFTVSLKSNSENETNIEFLNYVAEVLIFSDNRLILKKIIGNNVINIKLFPGEIRSFIGEIDYDSISDYLINNLDISRPKKRSLFGLSGKKVNLTAKMVFNIEKKLSTTIDFKHEVK